MENKKIAQYGFVHALGVVVYVALVASFMTNAEHWLGKMPENNILGPMAMLLLFVLSATITGSLVLGKPVLLYLGGEKKGAIRLFFATVGWLFVLMLCILFLISIR